MTPDELRALCTGPQEYMVFHVAHLPGRTAGTIGLTPSGGPRGEILCCPRDGGTTGRWKSSAVLRWLDRQEKR